MTLAGVTVIVNRLPVGTPSTCGTSSADRTLFEITGTWSEFDLMFQGLQRSDGVQSWCMDEPQPIATGRSFRVLAPVAESDSTITLMFQVDDDPNWLRFDLH